MTPPAIRITNTTLSVASSNYTSDGATESLNTLRATKNVPLLKGGALNVDFGADANIDWNNLNNTTIAPAFEARYKQKFTDHTRGYIRYRHIGEARQLRIAGGASVNLKIASIYADAHYTIKQAGGELKKSCGAWIGTDIPVNEHLSAWGELQKNIGSPIAFNLGLNYKF